MNRGLLGIKIESDSRIFLFSSLFAAPGIVATLPAPKSVKARSISIRCIASLLIAQLGKMAIKNCHVVQSAWRMGIFWMFLNEAIVEQHVLINDLLQIDP